MTSKQPWWEPLWSRCIRDARYQRGINEVALFAERCLERGMRQHDASLLAALQEIVDTYEHPYEGRQQ